MNDAGGRTATRPFAATSVQLFKELAARGYTRDDLVSVRRAYDLAAKLFSGRYRTSGNTFISHLVGTASILSALDVSPTLVAASVVHATYPYGDFGRWRKRVVDSQRRSVARLLGEEIEEYLYGYAVLRWSPHTIPVIRAKLASFSQIDRDVILMRLANELDVHAARGALYGFDAERRRRAVQTLGPSVVAIAEQLGFPILAAQLTRAYAETSTAEVAEEFRRSRKHPAFIVPRSYRRRRSIVLYQRLSSRLHRSIELLRQPNRPAPLPRFEPVPRWVTVPTPYPPVERHAQTSVQLFNQLELRGRSNEDLRRILRAHELAIQLFSGCYSASGKTIVAHSIGTASVLLRVDAPADVVAAGLLHSAYSIGDFGSWRRGLSERKRAEVRRVVGAGVEEYVFRFARQRFDPEGIRAARARLRTADAIERHVLLIELADILDHHRDGGVLYRADAERRRSLVFEVGPVIVEIAEELGFPSLAGEIAHAFGETLRLEVPAELRGKEPRGSLIAARSWRRKPSVAFGRVIADASRRLRGTPSAAS